LSLSSKSVDFDQLKSLLSLPVAAIFSSTLCGWCSECVAEPSKARNVLPHHKAAQKKLYSSQQTSESSMKQACHEHKPKLKPL